MKRSKAERGGEGEIVSIINNTNNNNNGNNKWETSSDDDENELVLMKNKFGKRGRYQEEEKNGGGKWKGVVPQQNGHWGAQIYANHQRIWLGTFKSHTQAAMAYDSASIKLRTSQYYCHRNFPWNHQTLQEPLFQSHYTTDLVLAMIRDGSYPSKFAAFLKHQEQQGEEEEEQEFFVGGGGVISDDNKSSGGGGGGGCGCSSSSGSSRQIIKIRVKSSKGGEHYLSCREQFHKELTPSDVGKLNRLVIPKKHAVTYFPPHASNNAEIEVVFYDRLMRSWKFRYCYWKSSQSYVFTRGWNRFVKDNKLRPKDTIAFYLCQPQPQPTSTGKYSSSREDNHQAVAEGQVFSLIDVIYTADADNADHADHDNLINYDGEELDEGGSQQRVDVDLNNAALQHHSGPDTPKGAAFRLFGVSIN